MNNGLSEAPDVGWPVILWKESEAIYEWGSPSSYILTILIGLVIWLVWMYIYTHDYDHDWMNMDKVLVKYEEQMVKANKERNDALQLASRSRWDAEICHDDLREYQLEFGIKAP